MVAEPARHPVPQRGRPGGGRAQPAAGRRAGSHAPLSRTSRAAFSGVPEGGGPIGFLKLREHAVGTCEMVIVIGDETLWGNGYGRQAVRAAVAKVFLEWRGTQPDGPHLSRETPVGGPGVRLRLSGAGTTEKLSCYRITREEYLAQAGRGGSLRYGT